MSKKKEILNPMEKNPQNDLVYPGERVDDLQNGLYVIQNPEKFCFGMDAVLLSGFADIRQNEKVLDMGTGTGIIPFLLKAKDKGSHLTGLEIQEECADMARRSVSYNHLEADIDIVCGDIKEAAEIFGAASFHAVTSNPPYMIGQHGLQNPYMAKAIAKPAISAEQKQKNKKQLRIQIKRHWMLYLFLLPCIVWLLVFCYTPMAGIVLAFKTIGLTSESSEANGPDSSISGSSLHHRSSG